VSKSVLAFPVAEKKGIIKYKNGNVYDENLKRCKKEGKGTKQYFSQYEFQVNWKMKKKGRGDRVDFL